MRAVRPRRQFIGSILSMISAALSVILAYTVGAAAPAAAATRAVNDIGQVVSSLEVNKGYEISRDCGFTGVPQANTIGVLWLFCDTAVSPTGQRVWGTTAGTAQAFTAPNQSLFGDFTDASGNNVVQFIPNPSGFSCGGTLAAWASGTASIPTSSPNPLLIIPYVLMCLDGSNTRPLAFRIVDYDYTTNTFSNDSPVGGNGIFTGSPLADNRTLGSPVVYNGSLYFYTGLCTSSVFGDCSAGTAQVAKVTLGSTPFAAYNASNRSGGHRWLDPRNYTFSTLAATSGGFTPITPASFDVHRYPAFSGSPFVAIEQDDIGGNITVFSSSSPTGPFTPRFTAAVPCNSTTGDGGLCRAYIGHPESSTSSKLMFSYFQPSDSHGNGHVRTAWIPWS
ncbi:hypothetical protein [Pseudofrankia saprophytica]|uniref:hypothetical protein n=1 Tax=Pseudofrankia saprophytica TaxID=298655 RepID=UPI000234CD0D|nr:hypothetical protein [Pseudofrankia saprophytica]